LDPHHECVLAIGRDNVAYLSLDTESLAKLQAFEVA
jgi:hypothetical protein